MIECRILHGPLAFDRLYETDEKVVLSNHDAKQLEGYGLVEVLGEVKPKFIPSIKKEVIPTEDEVIPTEDEVIPTEDEVIPTEDEVIPTEDEVIPVVEEETPASTRKRKK